jgi:hypothetical protein
MAVALAVRFTFLEIDGGEKPKQHATVQKRTVQHVHHLHVATFVVCTWPNSRRRA